MATQIWRGAAKAVPQVTSVTPANIEPGDTFTLTINRKDITVTASQSLNSADQPSCVAAIVSAFVSAIGQYNNDEPEWAEVSASAGTDSNGNTTFLRITGPTDGKPFTVSASVADGAMTLLITTVQEAKAAKNEIQRIKIPAGAGGTLNLTFEGNTTSSFAYNASTATITSALEALSNIAVGDVTVTGTAGDYYDVEFKQAFASTQVARMIANTSSLTGSASDIIRVVQGSQGGGAFRWTITKTDTTSTDGWRLRMLMTTGETKLMPFVSSNATVAEIAAAMLSIGIWVDTSYYLDGNTPTWEITFISATWEPDTITIDTQDNAGTITYGSGVYTATEGSVPQEIQYIQFLGGFTSYTLTIDGETSGSITTALAADIKTALDALSGITTVTATDVYTGSLVKVTFTAAEGDISKMAVTITGGYPFINVVTVQEAVVAQNEIQRVAIQGSPTGGTFTLTYSGQTTSGVAYNASAATLQTALEALSNIGVSEAITTGNPGGPWFVEFKGTLAAANQPLMTGDGSSLTAASTQTLNATTTTNATGPNDASQANNWYNPSAPTTAAAPVAGDTVIFRDSSVDCLYNLEFLTGVTLAVVQVEASYLGRIGLPRYNGLYYEYRPRRWKSGITALTIGQGNGIGSSRLKFNLEAVASTVLVLNTGTSEDDTEALTITGTNASNVVRILKGNVGIGTEEPGDAPVVATTTIGYVTSVEDDSQVRITGATLTTVNKHGGRLLLNSGATTVTQRAGTLITDTSSTITTLNVDGGSCEARGSGTITTLNVYTGAIFSLSGNAAGCTVTNTNIYGGATLEDPFERATFTNPIALVKCGVEDVTLLIGKDITLARA
jgi:hypothetical protein